MKWVSASLEAIDSGLKMKGHGYDIESLQKLSQYLQDKRVCIDKGKVFVSTLDEIEKNNYHLIEDVPISEWGIDIEDPGLRKHKRGVIQNLKILSVFNLYGSDGDLFSNWFDTKKMLKLYKHNDY